MLYIHLFLEPPQSQEHLTMLVWWPSITGPEFPKDYSTKTTLQVKPQTSFPSISHSKLWQGWLGWICFSTSSCTFQLARKESEKGSLSDTAKEISGKGSTNRKPGTPRHYCCTKVSARDIFTAALWLCHTKSKLAFRSQARSICTLIIKPHPHCRVSTASTYFASYCQDQ